MTDTTLDVATSSDTADAVEAGRATAVPHRVGGTTSTLYAVTDRSEGTRIVDTRVRDDHYLEHPRRKAGQYEFTQTDSFIAYVERHGTDGTEVFVDSGAASARAVIDGHASQHAGHEEHVASLTFPRSSQWETWIKTNGKAMPQRMFAEFVEDNLVDIVDPANAQMLEIVSSLSATTKASFKSAHRLSDGETQLEWVQEINASAGTSKSGRVEIPAEFRIGIPVFRGGEAHLIRARFRYRINDGDLHMSFHLDRPQDVLDGAFTREVEALEAGLPEAVPVFVG